MELNEGGRTIASFFQSFDVSYIYDIGWHAAQSWITGISITLLIISIWIRSVREGIKLIGGKGELNKMAVEVIIMACCIGGYLAMAALVADVFNAIYQSIDAHTISRLTDAMQATILQIINKEKEWSFTILSDTLIGGTSLAAFYFTFSILIAVTFFLRLLHALLVSLCLFWGAVALPISVCMGKDVLESFRKLTLFVLFWPIIEAFLMFISSSMLAHMMQSDSLSLVGADKISATQAAMAFFGFAIMNVILIATAVGTPFVTQGLVNGTGNISGMIASFAGAGVTAGVVAFNVGKKALLKGAGAGGSSGQDSGENENFLSKSARVMAGVTAGSMGGNWNGGGGGFKDVSGHDSSPEPKRSESAQSSQETYQPESVETPRKSQGSGEAATLTPGSSSSTSGSGGSEPADSPLSEMSKSQQTQSASEPVSHERLNSNVASVASSEASPLPMSNTYSDNANGPRTATTHFAEGALSSNQVLESGSPIPSAIPNSASGSQLQNSENRSESSSSLEATQTPIANPRDPGAEPQQNSQHTAAHNGSQDLAQASQQTISNPIDQGSGVLPGRAKTLSAQQPIQGTHTGASSAAMNTGNTGEMATSGRTHSVGNGSASPVESAIQGGTLPSASDSANYSAMDQVSSSTAPESVGNVKPEAKSSAPKANADSASTDKNPSPKKALTEEQRKRNAKAGAFVNKYKKEQLNPPIAGAKKK